MILAWVAAAWAGSARDRIEALEASFDAAAAARDRAQADLDACKAQQDAAARADVDAAARRREVDAVFARLPGAVGATWDTSDAAWFAAGTADPATPPVAFPALAGILGDVGAGTFVVEVAADPTLPLDTREYPSPLHLAADRAVAVVRALVAAGLPADHVAASAVLGAGRVRVRWVPPAP